MAVKKKPRRKVVSKLEEDFASQVKKAALPAPIREYAFAAPLRKWRFDFAWKKEKVAVEVEGAIFRMGRHSRGLGMLADMEKYNQATCMGWRVLRVAAPHLKSGEAVAWLAQLLTEDP